MLPHIFDFLSIDTEGSEYDIIGSVDHAAYRFGAICVEHNYNRKLRRRIHDFLVAHGYRRVHLKASAWDDWYVPAT